MKKLKIMLLVLIGLAMIAPMNSCKKGADDPLISLKSRKARLAGEWKVTSWSETYTSGTSTTTYNYADGTITYNSGTVTQTGTFTWDWTIEKDGTYNYKRSTTWSGVTNSYEEDGNWFFTSGNKDNDVKNKEFVCFQSTKRVYTDASGTDSYTEEGTDLKWYRLTQLKSKEIVGETDQTYTGSSTSSTKVKFVLTAK